MADVGISLIGHAFQVFGIVEDVRLAARGLQRSRRRPLCLHLVCQAAAGQARWLRQSGCDPLRERYTLSSWPLETQQWPEAWLPLLQVADELWPSSRFTAAALAGPAVDAGRPLQVMPMAALEAFQLAFPLPHLPATFGRDCNHHPLSEHVALLIKTFPPLGFSAEWHWLQARAEENPRIVLMAESLPREELLALYGCCDVFLSLHRSEGFGRRMAEALQLGVDVIATDFGGNTDFCTGPLAHSVRWRPAPIPRGAYPDADGHSWAEPDLEHAAELCHQVAERRLSRDIRGYPVADDPSRDPAVLAGYRERFSFASVGARYRARLDELWAERESVGKRLRWRADRSPVGWRAGFRDSTDAPLSVLMYYQAIGPGAISLR